MKSLSDHQNLDLVIQSIDDQSRIVTVVTQQAARLAMVEVALGAGVHAFKIPIGGHLLSLNQGLFLTRVVRDLRGIARVSQYPLYVANISAILKSLSPAGNKLGPMLSISAQGCLYSTGILIFGANLFGVVIGMMALSLWAFVQPLLTLYVLMGNSFVQALEFYLHKVQQGWGLAPQRILMGLGVLVAVKALIAALVGWCGYRMSPSQFQQFEERVAALAKRFPQRRPQTPAPTHHGQRALLAARDLLRPWFLLSLVLTGLFFYFSESSWSALIWVLLRPLAIGFALFYISRSPRFASIVTWLRRFRAFDRFMMLFDRTVAQLTHVS
jgi:hypothetical protein